MTIMLSSVGPVNSLGYMLVTVMLTSVGPVNSLGYRLVTIMLSSVEPVNSLGYWSVTIKLLSFCQFFEKNTGPALINFFCLFIYLSIFLLIDYFFNCVTCILYFI